MTKKMKEVFTDKKKEWAIIMLKCIIFAVCSGILTALTHMVCSRFILHIHGKPAFLTNSLIIFSACEKLLFAVGYITLGRRIPIKNSILRGILYLGIIWTSNFLPQYMGLAFADGPIAEQVFVLSDVVCDSIVYLVSGVILGMLFLKTECTTISRNQRKICMKGVLASAIIYPLVIIIGDQLLGAINPRFSSQYAMQVSELVKIPFYINFYSWFILSGIVISIFYQKTRVEDEQKNWWIRFALNYALLIWSPVVLIMIVFGTEIIPTIVYDAMFVASIVLLCWINEKILL